ncbi:MAG: DNA primase [Planctomycetota bacterium]
MSQTSWQEIKEQVRQATNIVDLVGGYLELRRQGAAYLARCPFHDDQKPSLNINPVKQYWRCFVCDIGGDVFDFVMRKERVTFPEALRILADRVNIPLVPMGPKAKPGSVEDKQTLFQAMAWAEKQFVECLRSSDGVEARRYLADRGIDENSVRRFQIGYSPSSWQWLLDRARSTAFSPSILEACGMVGRNQSGDRYYDRFRGRVIFPIHDSVGRPIAFGGRVMPGPGSENTAKYVNSPETRLFTKSDTLYALDVAKDAIGKQRSIVVVEGYTDVVLAHQCGVGNVVAVLGTAINARHLALMRRFADTIYLVLDGDKAGQRRTNEVLELFVAHQVDLRIATLPEGLDPADFFLRYSADQFRQRLSEAVDALEHRFRASTRGVNKTFDTHQSNRALEEILTTVARGRLGQGGTGSGGGPVRDTLREQQMLTRVAREFDVDQDSLRRRVQELVRQLRATQRQSAANSAGNSAVPPPPAYPSRPLGVTHEVRSSGSGASGAPGGATSGGTAGPSTGATADATADELAGGESGVGDAFLEAGGDDSWEFGAADGESKLTGGNGRRSAPPVGQDTIGNGGESSALVGASPDMAGMPAMEDFAGMADVESGEAAGPPLMLGDLSAEEIELLEILVLHAELAPLAFSRVRVDDLRGKPAKTLFNTFRMAREMGESADFRSVLSELDDPRLKSLLIQLDESATRKAVVASLGPDVRLNQLCERFEARREEKVLREELTEMERGTMDYASQMATLLKQFELARKRQGLTSPMEG